MDTTPDDPPDVIPANVAADRHPFRSVILGAWADLFRPRNELLLRCYVRLPDVTAPGASPPANLDEARARAASLEGHGLSEIDRDHAEAGMLRVTRVLAAWIAFWSTVVPLIVIAAFVVWRLGRLQRGNWVDYTVIAACSAILFPLLAILCLLLQAPLLRPLLALLTRRSSTRLGITRDGTDKTPGRAG